MKKVLVKCKYRFPFWRVLVYSTYSDNYVTYLRPEKFFSKMKAKELAKKIRFND